MSDELLQDAVGGPVVAAQADLGGGDRAVQARRELLDLLDLMAGDAIEVRGAQRRGELAAARARSWLAQLAVHRAVVAAEDEVSRRLARGSIATFSERDGADDLDALRADDPGERIDTW